MLVLNQQFNQKVYYYFNIGQIWIFTHFKNNLVINAALLFVFVFPLNIYKRVLGQKY